MNFFERQDQARRASRRLIVLYVLAVLAVIAAVDLLVAAALTYAETRVASAEPSLTAWLTDHPGTMLTASLIVLGIVTLASLYKTTVLGSGGAVVAQSLGGVRVSPDTTDPHERRLLNVVEEMAIASGVPMPEVYLLEQESGINAFAAGHNPANAAIGVTRGTLDALNRAELQGVIAHEFSHVLNGDMRLNMRLMGLAFGLLVIAVIGRTLLRVASGGRGKKGGVAIVIAIALGVMVIGYVGLFFGRLIQAAVSRTRESLADASAIQFTRDPTGLRGALVKIGAASAGSRIGNPQAEEVAHMLFAPGMRRMFATHPPLLERLQAIDPRFDPAEIDQMRARLIAAGPAVVEVPAKSQEQPQTTAAPPARFRGEWVAGLVGNPGTGHMQVARAICRSLPEAIVLAGRHAQSARALLLALALDEKPETRERQKHVVAAQLSAEVAAVVGALERAVDSLEPEQRMPVLLRAVPALRQLTREERMRLMSCLNAMLQQEGRMSLQSYVLRKLAQVQLRDDLAPATRPKQLSLDSVSADARVLFSVLAQHGHPSEIAARRAYEAGMHRLFPRQRPAYAAPANWATPLDLALSRLDQVAPIVKEQLVAAMVETVTHDQQLTIGEAELLRAVCASIHCPLPPLVGQDG